MSYLFIDSTYDLTLGVLDDGLQWLDFEKHSGQKASTIIQTRAYELLNKNNIAPEKLTGVISVNGPGFYTGLRLAMGFADVLSFFGIPCYSFYSYEIPAWCGEKSGTWFTKAYRGEYFLYHWTLEKQLHELLSVKEIPDRLKTFDKVFIHSDASLDDLSRRHIKSSETTFDLLKSSPELIFKQVLGHKLSRESFYFRAPEDEFKANP